MKQVKKIKLVNGMVDKVRLILSEGASYAEIKREQHPDMSKDAWKDVISFLLMDGYRYSEKDGILKFWKEG